jgi:hypothetical protein
MKRWDAFISHATEDKEIVLDLAHSLRAAGLAIWIDSQELKLGDSLSQKIDEGLAASRFGIVVLSPNFIAKRWPRQELNGLMAREESGRKVILPVWHEIDKQTIAEYSPILADRRGGRTDNGMAAVAREIIEVVLDPASGSPAIEAPTLKRRFIGVLDKADVTALDIREFLAFYPEIVSGAVGGEIHSPVRVGDLEFDIGALRREGTTATEHWTIIRLAHPSRPLFDGGSRPVEAIERHVAELDALRRSIPRSAFEVHRQFPGLSSTFQGVVIAGRRSSVGPDEAVLIRRYNEELLATTLRTYDWLVEAADSVAFGS